MRVLWNIGSMMIKYRPLILWCVNEAQRRTLQIHTSIYCADSSANHPFTHIYIYHQQSRGIQYFHAIQRNPRHTPDEPNRTLTSTYTSEYIYKQQFNDHTVYTAHCRMPSVRLAEKSLISQMEAVYSYIDWIESFQYVAHIVMSLNSLRDRALYI